MDHLPGKMLVYTGMCILCQELSGLMFPQELIYGSADFRLRKINKLFNSELNEL